MNTDFKCYRILKPVMPAEQRPKHRMKTWAKGAYGFI